MSDSEIKYCISRPIDVGDTFTFHRCPYLEGRDCEEGRYNECKLMPDKMYSTWEEQYRNCPLQKK